MIIRQMNKEKWKTLLDNNQHSVFQTSEWIDALSEDGWQPIYLVNKDWSGGMVFMENKDQDAYESLRLGCHGGVVGNMVNVCELMSTDMNYIRIVDYPDTLHLDGWAKSYTSTYLLDLKNYRMSHGRKADLKIANDIEMLLEITTDVELFYRLYLQAMTKFPGTKDIKSLDYFNKIMKSGLAKFFIAWCNKEPIAVSVHLFYNRKIFNYITMVVPGYEKSGAITYITKTIIDEFNDYDTYNFGASVSKGTGTYKRSWGASEYQYPIYGLIFNLKYTTI